MFSHMAEPALAPRFGSENAIWRLRICALRTSKNLFLTAVALRPAQLGGQGAPWEEALTCGGTEHKHGCCCEVPNCLVDYGSNLAQIWFKYCSSLVSCLRMSILAYACRSDGDVPCAAVLNTNGTWKESAPHHSCPSANG